MNAVQTISEIMIAKQMVLQVLAALVLLSAPAAQAFYNPHTGRWLSRDPIGEPGHQLLVHTAQTNGTCSANTQRPQGSPSKAIAACRTGELRGPRDGELMLYPFCRNDPIGCVDMDGRDFQVPGPVKQWYKLQAGVGVAIFLMDSCILYLACERLQVGEETFVRTPGTRILTVPLLPVIAMLCPDGGVVYYRVWKPNTAGCDNELVVFCLGSGTGA